MRRHDEVLARADKRAWRSVGTSYDEEVIRQLADALREEIEAHDLTRDARNAKTQHVVSLLGNVRGLESKVSALQAELDSANRTKYGVLHDVGATSYHEGYLAGLVAARAAIEALEKT